MPYCIIIEEIKSTNAVPPESGRKKIFEQTVDEISLNGIIAAINRKPRKSRAKTPPKDAT